jgi:hypothetical protein
MILRREASALAVHSLAVPFIKHLSIIQGLSDQRVALLVAPGGILRTARHKINGEIRVNAVQDFQGFPKALAVKIQHHQKVHVGVQPFDKLRASFSRE